MSPPGPARYDPKIIGFAVVTLPGWRLALLGVTYERGRKLCGYPDVDVTEDRIVVDRDYLIRRFTSGQAARRALDAARAHWATDRSLAYAAVQREIDE
jgi:hypothetical protein